MALAESRKLKESMLTRVLHYLHRPGSLDDPVSDKPGKIKLPDKLMHQLMDLLRISVDETDLSVLIQVRRHNSTVN